MGADEAVRQRGPSYYLGRGLAVAALLCVTLGVTPAGHAQDQAPAVGAGLYPYSHFEDLWQRRREALQRGDMPAAATLLGELILTKERSGWPDFFAFAGVLARESRAAAAAGNGRRALELGQAAVALGPHRLSSHMAMAASLWANHELGAGLGALVEALVLTWHEPPLLWARLGNLALSLVVATLLATWVFVLVGLFRHGTLVLHDLGQHVLPKGAGPLQTRLVAVTLFVGPVLWRFGGMLTCVLSIVALAAYYAKRERLAAVVLLAVLALAPLALPRLSMHLAYPGSRAEDLYLAARDAGASDAVARIQAQPTPLADELFILAMRARWAGDAALARALFQRAVQAGALYPDVMVGLGNAKFMLGDSAGAIEAYKQALVLEPRHLLALFNLSQIYPLAGDQLKGDEFRYKANDVDRRAVIKLTTLTQATGAQIQDAPIPRPLLARGVEMPGDAIGDHRRACEQLWERMGGGGSRWTLTVLAALGIVWILACARIIRHPAAPVLAAGRCERCGAVACRRCHALATMQQCADCIAAFEDQDGRAQHLRIQKEIESHRFYARRLKIQRIVNLFVAGAGQLVGGASMRGLLFVVAFACAALGVAMAFGFVPEPVAMYGGLGGVFGVFYGSLAALVYVMALIDAQREEI